METTQTSKRIDKMYKLFSYKTTYFILAVVCIILFLSISVRRKSYGLNDSAQRLALQTQTQPNKSNSTTNTVTVSHTNSIKKTVGHKTSKTQKTAIYTANADMLETNINAKLATSHTKNTHSDTIFSHTPRLYLGGSTGTASLGQADILSPIFLTHDADFYLYGQARYAFKNKSWTDHAWRGGVGLGYRPSNQVAYCDKRPSISRSNMAAC